MAQIRAGGPVTLTHQDITRYFMTIPEAAQLVIQAGAMAKGGEVFVLDMGQPVRIRDLAASMVRLSGLSVRDDAHPDGDIEIREIGMRPGEKLYEELLIGENPQPTMHERIIRASETMLGWDDLERALVALSGHLERGDASEALDILRELVPEYAPPTGYPAMQAAAG
jgi:FlaA1/EpsC-like NDP-sugar epimerase